MISTLVTAAAAFPPVDQDYLLEARQMQALSFAVHIPLGVYAYGWGRSPHALTSPAGFPS